MHLSTNRSSNAKRKKKVTRENLKKMRGIQIRIDANERRLDTFFFFLSPCSINANIHFDFSFLFSFTVSIVQYKEREQEFFFFNTSFFQIHSARKEFFQRVAIL